MATKTFLTIEEVDVTGGKAWSVAAGPTQEEVAFSDGVTLADAVTGEGVVVSEGVTVDSIGISESFEAEVAFAASQCTPVGYGYPVLELQEADFEDGEAGTYDTVYQHIFDSEDYRLDSWGIEKHPRGNDLIEVMEDLTLRNYPYDVQLYFDVGWKNNGCDTDFLRFLLLRWFDWLATTPYDKVRRALLYISGTLQTDRYGDLLGGLEIRLDMTTGFLQRTDGQRGKYDGMIHMTTKGYSPGDWQANVPWGGLWS